MTLQVATPLRAFLSEPSANLPKVPTLDADAIVREIITHAGVLPDAAPGGDRFVLVALPPHLVDALAAHARTAIDPMPLFPGRA